MAEWHDDKPDRWTPMIEASHPLNTGAHDVYATAMEMVGNRRSKSALVDLVCWLLQRARDADSTAAAPPSGLHESAQAVEPEWFISPTRVPLREGYFYTQAQMYDLTWGPEIRLWWNGQSWRTCAIGRYRFDMHRRWRASPPPGSVDTAAAPEPKA